MNYDLNCIMLFVGVTTLLVVIGTLIIGIKTLKCSKKTSFIK